jgi:hypothetical protein
MRIVGNVAKLLGAVSGHKPEVRAAGTAAIAAQQSDVSSISPGRPLRSASRTERLALTPRDRTWQVRAPARQPRRSYIAAGHVLCFAAVGIWIGIIALLRARWFPDFNFLDADFWSPGDVNPERVAILIPASRPLIVVPVASLLLSMIAGWIAAVPPVNRALVDGQEELWTAVFQLVALASAAGICTIGFMVTEPTLSLVGMILIPWMLFVGLFLGVIVMVLMFVPFALGVWLPAAVGFAASHRLACVLLKPPHRLRLLS